MTKTDNTALDVKVRQRLAHLPENDRPLRVLDCFHGTGAIWTQVERRSGRTIDVLGIDTRNMGPKVLRGDNRKIIPTLDLSRFDVVDLDAYGWPCAQLEAVTAQNFPGPIFTTTIATAQGVVPRKALAAIGITDDMARTAPTLCNKALPLVELYSAYLAHLGYLRAWLHTWHRGGSKGVYGVLNSPQAQ